jgi:hypothetical protein
MPEICIRGVGGAAGAKGGKELLPRGSYAARGLEFSSLHS